MLLRHLMRFSIPDLFDAEGQQIPIWKLPRHVAAAIKGIRPTKHGTILEFRNTVHPADVKLKVFGRLKESVKVGRSLEDILEEVNSLEKERTATAEGDEVNDRRPGTS